jgi:hypothetical protein
MSLASTSAEARRCQTLMTPDFDERGSPMPLEENTLAAFDLTRLLLGKLSDGAMARVPILWMNAVVRKVDIDRPTQREPPVPEAEPKLRGR